MQRRQLDLLRAAQRRAPRGARSTPRLDARIQSFELAFRMQIEAADAFDICHASRSTSATLYGDGVHGRQTLIARRLLERGVRYVQLWHGAGQPWDNHDNIEGNHRKLAARDRSADRRAADRSQAARHARRHARHLGRRVRPHADGRTGRRRQVASSAATTTTTASPSGWPAAASRAARSTARPTSSASRPSRIPTSVHDLHATILHLLGFDHERLTYRYAGRDFRLTDVHGKGHLRNYRVIQTDPRRLHSPRAPRCHLSDWNSLALQLRLVFW